MTNMRWAYRILFGLSLSAPVFLHAPAASADTVDPGQRAKDLYKESLTKYREGNFQKAVELLQEAYKIKAEPVLLYNLGRAYEGLGENEKAIKAYQDYLAQETQVVDRKALETRIATLKKQIAERERLQNEKKEAEERERNAKKPTVVPWIVAGVGAAGVASGVVFALIAKNHNSHADDPATDQITATDEKDQAKSFGTVANISFAVGGGLLATGLVWGFIASRNSGTNETKTATVEPILGLGSAGLRGTF